MLIETILFGIASLLFLVTFEIGEIVFFIVLVILAFAVVIKIIKNKKKSKSNS